MQLIFTFSINPETKEAAFAGNIEPMQALQVLQQLVIAEAIRKAKIDPAESGEKIEEKANVGQT